MKFVVPLLAALWVVGCAAPAAESPGKASALQCTRETPTGSNIAVTRCRTAEQVALEKDGVGHAGEAIDRGKAGKARAGGQ